MSQDDELGHDEIVVRVLIRVLPAPPGANARKLLDAVDFVRRDVHPKTRQAENGISLLRKSILVTPHEIYSYIGSKRAMGIAQCKLGQLTSMGFKYVVSGKRNEHLSLRCPGCDKSDLKSNQPCKPVGATNFMDCKLFDVDHFKLRKIFQLVEAPAIRFASKG